MQKTNLLAFIIMGFFMLMFIGSISASLDSLGTFQQNNPVRIAQVCADATYINISSITYPNSTRALNNIQMTYVGSGEYNYTFSNTADLGRYDVRGISDGCDKTFATYFEITQNGQDKPTGAVIVIFIIIFILLLVGVTYIIINSIGHAVSLDFDIIDLAWNYGLFFAIAGLKIAQDSYLGNVAIESFISWAVKIGIYVLMVLPTIYFILTLTMGSIISKRVKGVNY